jgi:replication fork protection complex subunit Tof1/Swi1
MFKDNKLRLLMTLVGFSRIGEDHDPDASWIVPSSLSSSELSSAIDLIRRFEFDLPVYEDGKSAEDFLRSKAAAARSRQRADYDDDSDGIDNDSQEDRGEYALDGPTKIAAVRKKLQRRRRRSRTPQELDDEELDRRADARRKKEREKQAKVKSTMFVHDSDEESDEERDKEFFAREEAIRRLTEAQHLKAMALASTEPASKKKRKADEDSGKGRKKRKSVDGDGDDGAMSLSSRSSSPELVELESEDDEDEAMDTPLSSQHAGPAKASSVEAPASLKGDVVMGDGADEDEDEEDAPPVVRKVVARNTRAGFIIDSDSE